MHELTLAENVLAIAEAAARREGSGAVKRVKLAIGTMAHVDADTLVYCCGLIARGTLCENAEYEVEKLAAEARCNDCGAEGPISDWGEPCPACGSYRRDVLRGEEMRVLEIAVADTRPV